MHSPSIQTNVTNNRRTAGLYDTYAAHRESVMALVANTPPGRGRIAFLGAGNCNDIDVNAVRQRFEEISLVDLDSGAITAGLARQRVPAESVRILAPYDFSAPLLDRIDVLNRNPSAAREVADELLRASVVPNDSRDSNGPDVDARFDVIVSGCVISQIIHSVLQIPFESADDLAALVAAVRLAHLNRISGWLAPGGSCILVTDFVSSDSAPELLDPGSLNLGQYASDQINRGNFFTGVNPAAVQETIRRHPTLEQIAPATIWVWSLAVRRYLVAGFQIRKIADAAIAPSRTDRQDRDG